MQHFFHRLFLFIFSPILVFVFGDDHQQPLNSHLDLNTHHISHTKDVFDINSKLPSVYHTSTRQNISKELYDELEELARVVDVSYCVGYSGIRAPFNCLGRCSEFPSFQLVETWNTGPYLSDSCGYIALSHPPAPKRIIIAFRGTYSLANAIADLSLSKQSYLPYPSDGHSSPTPEDQKCENCTVHSGFLESWTQAERLIGETVSNLVKVWKAERGYELVLVGHSLGGAVAALAALEFNAKGYGPVVTTFGEPRVGNEALARFIDGRFTPETYRRLTHVNDPVPLLPLNEWGFAPHQTEFYIDQKELPPKQERILRCEGPEDKECIAGGGVNPLQLFWSHRDYFVRLGVCLKDPRRLLLEGDKEDGISNRV
ncbi:alpha/beta-hydrolase [Terfezia boudieri ATCC MYA-4762]|uniref:Alpha/beta-hydrolase n=1 Tax=Terfezia boudieri ATCC MYA-4762 TaxID=1051890 RepID=A0A3N4M6Y8_9PEZI|nr:alpha/beta-hydrolase [Terfezia boudieri ATCC MYA-4762]